MIICFWFKWACILASNYWLKQFPGIASCFVKENTQKLVYFLFLHLSKLREGVCDGPNNCASYPEIRLLFQVKALRSWISRLDLTKIHPKLMCRKIDFVQRARNNRNVRFFWLDAKIENCCIVSSMNLFLSFKCYLFWKSGLNGNLRGFQFNIAVCGRFIFKMQIIFVGLRSSGTERLLGSTPNLC